MVWVVMHCFPQCFHNRHTNNLIVNWIRNSKRSDGTLDKDGDRDHTRQHCESCPECCLPAKNSISPNPTSGFPYYYYASLVPLVIIIASIIYVFIGRGYSLFFLPKRFDHVLCNIPYTQLNITLLLLSLLLLSLLFAPVLTWTRPHVPLPNQRPLPGLRLPNQRPNHVSPKPNVWLHGVSIKTRRPVPVVCRPSHPCLHQP